MKKDFTFWKFLSKLKEFYKPFLGAIVIIFLLMLLQEALSLVAPYIYGKIIDGILQEQEFYQVINLCLISLGILVLNNVFLAYVKEKFEIKNFELDVPRFISEKTLEGVLDFSIGQHENQNSGMKKSIIDRGQSALIELANLLMYGIFPVFLQVFVTVIALFIVSPILGFILLGGLIIFILFILYTNKIFSKDLEKVQDMWVDSDKKQSEFLRNASLIKINAKEDEVTKEYNNNLLKINIFEKNIWTRFIAFAKTRNFISDINRTFILITGVYLIYQKVYTPGFLVVFLSWANNAFDRIGYLSYMQRRINHLYSAIKNYFTLISIKSNIKEVDDPIVLEEFKGKIEYKNIFFKYPEREFIGKDIDKIKKEAGLKNINILIEPGQRIAIVGHSGAGKSTLIQLLIRAYDPDKGSILIDNNDLKDLSLKDYRNSLGVVPQEVSLFDNTLRYNILFGAKKSVNEDELKEAVKMARIDDFVKTLEKGLDTIIGERGVKLSGGERQRVGIARALVKNPLILIFDEATSSLDVENESLIRESIEKASLGRTTIIIAHRLSTIKDADKIIVLEKGKVIGQGKHKELIKNCEVYNKMIKMQTVILGDD